MVPLPAVAVRFSGYTIVDGSELRCCSAGHGRSARNRRGAAGKSPQTGCWGKKVLAASPGSARGKNFGAIKLKTFFSQFWKKPFVMNGTRGARARAGKRHRRRGDFSPAARAGARCEYILCLPVLPSSVAKRQTCCRGARPGPSPVCLEPAAANQFGVRVGFSSSP